MSKVLEGYKEYLKRGDDPNLKKSKDLEGMFYLWSSIQTWVEEMTPTERIYHADEIPVKELILEEYKKNRFIAPP
ncbi:MAG: hypothetical protein ACE5KT_06660 [Methanosarcinales archaeon]